MATKLISEETGYCLKQAEMLDGKMIELKVLKLAAPSAEVARKGLASYDFDHAIGVAQVSAMAGSSMRQAYSMKELEASLVPLDTMDFALMQHSSIGYVDLVVLEHWVDEVIGDHDLATAIHDLVAQESTYGKAMPFIKELLQERLAAYKLCLQPVDDAGDGESAADAEPESAEVAADAPAQEPADSSGEGQDDETQA